MTPKRIDNRRDILLLLLYSPGVQDETNEPIVGRTRLVKMLFLFKTEAFKHFRGGTALNESEFYQFFPWNFGPFSSQVYDDLTFFTLRGFIEANHDFKWCIQTRLDLVDEEASKRRLRRATGRARSIALRIWRASWVRLAASATP